MSKKILIEATHSEETRVAVVENGRLVDFDCEKTSKRPIKGNIYLAKVIRVEPSLQAAFVEYGGNRHGFLAFSEIHPDYFRIPIEDRKRLEASLKEKRAHLIEEETDVLDEKNEEITDLTEDASPSSTFDQPEENNVPEMEVVEAEGALAVDIDETFAAQEKPSPAAEGYADILRKYKIQEVIKSRQILLVQAIKEERGNKGAAMTTYVSLPGRYCVLMPNASSAGGVSRKITDHTDRKRLKKLLQELSVPEGMALIVRTAGMDRSKTEIKRDYKYLMTLWSEIRESTLKASAPSLVYEEGDLVKRVIRDYYARDIDEILVEGDEAYKLAKNVMRKVVPSHSKKVQPYKHDVPLFYKHNIEKQIDDIYQTQVRLRSGGYLVLHPTEALVSIDVNSGSATRERHIDSTALKTNLEAAEEVARQVRLRDLAGLIVIDFIDMVDPRHNSQVEKRLRDSLAQDRARIQVGRISLFGLLEMSRQRLRPSIQELSTSICHTCSGSGYVRSVDAMALQTLRLIGEHCIAYKPDRITVTSSSQVGVYLLNEKKHELVALENRFGVSIIMVQDDQRYQNGYRLVDDKENVISDTHEHLGDNLKEVETRDNGRNKRFSKKPQMRNGQNKDKKSKEPTSQTAGKEGAETEKETVEAENTANDSEMKENKRHQRGGRYRQRSKNNRDKEKQHNEGTKEPQNAESLQSQENKKSGEGKNRNRRRRYRKPGGQKRDAMRETSEKSDGQNEMPQVTGVSIFQDENASDASKRNTSQEKKGGPKKGNRKGWWKRLLD